MHDLNISSEKIQALKILIAATTVCTLVALTACGTPTPTTPSGGSVTGPVLTVKTRHGMVAGKQAGDSRLFLGIPYAQPPTGAYRWQPPRAAKPWSGVRSAREHGPVCPQYADEKRIDLIPDNSEDCLSLNIATPVGAEGLPVLISIHGGGFTAGSGRYMINTAPNLNAEGVVLATLNYRLGALGFFAHPNLPSARGVNYGLMDMVAALQWLKANIAAFGGDPDRMTIEGVSAGGKAVHMMMVAPAAAGLFAGAIAESGYGAWPQQPRTRDVVALPGAPRAETIALDIAGRATAKPATAVTREDLYAIPPANLVRAVSGFHLPIIDGLSLPEESAVLFARGEQQAVPFIGGGPSFDGMILPWSGVSAEQALGLTQGQEQRMRRLWAADFKISEDQGIQRFFGDIRYLYSGWNMTRNMTQVDQPGYLYLFDYLAPALKDQYPGAPHGSDYMALWGGDTSPTPTAMRNYWINFVKTGNPNGPGLVEWPAAAAGPATRWLVLGDEVTQQDEVVAERMAFLDELWRNRTAAARPSTARPAMPIQR